MPEARLIEAARQLSESLTPGDLDHTLSRITLAAVEVLPDVTHASISIKHADGALETVAPTDPLLCDLDAAQYDLREGPCYDAATEALQVTSPVLANDDRFPRYAKVATAAGIQAQAGVRLYETPRVRGALNLYSTRVGAFEDLGSIGELFAHQSAMAIEYAHEIGNLQDAIQTRKLIGQAVGIVMERYDLTDDRAFAFLARLSQHQNVKLRVMAQGIIDASHDRGS